VEIIYFFDSTLRKATAVPKVSGSDSESLNLGNIRPVD
jgi:hypothetical protein